MDFGLIKFSVVARKTEGFGGMVMAQRLCWDGGWEEVGLSQELQYTVYSD